MQFGEVRRAVVEQLGIGKYESNYALHEICLLTQGKSVQSRLLLDEVFVADVLRQQQQQRSSGQMRLYFAIRYYLPAAVAMENETYATLLYHQTVWNSAQGVLRSALEKQAEITAMVLLERCGEAREQFSRALRTQSENGLGEEYFALVEQYAEEYRQLVFD